MKYKGKNSLKNMLKDIKKHLEETTKIDYYYVNLEHKNNVCTIEIYYYPKQEEKNE